MNEFANKHPYISLTFCLFKKDLDSLEKDPVEVDLYLKAHGLEQVEALRDYILNNNIKQDSVNYLIQAQNNQNIANQAHGILGVNTAIKEYNKLTDAASRSKLAETINGTNSSLGKYLIVLNGADAGLDKYAASLATATLKEIALTAATTVMNMAISFGVSSIISLAVSAFSQLNQSMDDLHDNLEESINEFEESANNVKELEAELEMTNHLSAIRTFILQNKTTE